MKKTVLTIALAAVTLVAPLGVMADNNNCQPCDTTCNTPLVVKTYDKVKDGTVNTYDKVKEGTVNTYDKVATGSEKVYDKVSDGTVNTYNKAKKGVEKGANAVKEEWNKIF